MPTTGPDCHASLGQAWWVSSHSHPSETETITTNFTKRKPLKFAPGQTSRAAESKRNFQATGNLSQINSRENLFLESCCYCCCCFNRKVFASVELEILPPRFLNGADLSTPTSFLHSHNRSDHPRIPTRWRESSTCVGPLDRQLFRLVAHTKRLAKLLLVTVNPLIQSNWFGVCLSLFPVFITQHYSLSTLQSIETFLIHTFEGWEVQDHGADIRWRSFSCIRIWGTVPDRESEQASQTC